MKRTSSTAHLDPPLPSTKTPKTTDPTVYEKLHKSFFEMRFGPTQPSTKLAGFDMDWTLIKPKSGRKWPINGSDWTWLHDNTPGKLRQFHEQGFVIVVFTNQGGVAKGHTTVAELR